MGDKVEDLESRLAVATDLRTKIDLLCELAWELRDTDPGRSHDLSETAYQLAGSGNLSQRDSAPGMLKSLRGLAHSNRRAGNLTLALSQSTQALAHPEIAGLPAVQADFLRNITIILGSLGNYAEGLEYGLKALNLAQTIGDREREAFILGSIGVIYMHAKNTSESHRMLDQALQIHRELGQKRAQATDLNNKSVALREVGDYNNALETSLQALKLAMETNFPAAIVTVTGTVAEACLAMADYDQASHYLQQYLAAAQSTGSKRDETWALLLLGETSTKQRNAASALSYLSQALEIARPVGLRSEEARCHELLCEVHEQQGHYEQALAEFRLFYQAKETIFNDSSAQRIANLQVLHQVETAKRDAEINHLKTVELQREIEERKKIESELEHRVAVRTLELSLARDAAEAASRAKSAFLAVMGHELRTPLHGILLAAELLREQPQPPAQQAQYAEMILSSGRRLWQMVEGVLDYTATDAPAKVPVDAALILNDNLMRFEPRAARRELTLTFDIDQPLPTLLADPRQFDRMVQRLLDNAVRFTPAGGRIQVTSRGLPSCSLPAGSQPALEVAVFNSGAPLLPAEYDQLFEPFFQREVSHLQHSEGAGLGLALARRQAEAHGGTVTAKAAPDGQGHLFTLHLPLS
jgi:signal transduction histidine kinase